MPTFDFTNAFSGIQGVAMDAIEAALPIALGLFGIMIAVKLGIKVFNRVAR